MDIHTSTQTCTDRPRDTCTWWTLIWPVRQTVIAKALLSKAATYQTYITHRHRQQHLLFLWGRQRLEVTSADTHMTLSRFSSPKQTLVG